MSQCDENFLSVLQDAIICLASIRQPLQRASNRCTDVYIIGLEVDLVVLTRPQIHQINLV